MEEQYRKLVLSLANGKSEVLTRFNKMMQDPKESVMETVLRKVECLTEDEIDRASAYIELGYFSRHDDLVKLACYCIVLDAEYERELQKQIRDATPYGEDDPIFTDRNLLEQRNRDLINMPVGERKDGSNIFRRGSKWGYYDPRIPLQVYHWLEDCFKEKPKRIRVLPDGLYDKCPSGMLLECMIIPPQGKWWQDMRIYNGRCSGSSYLLLGNDVHNHGDYYDYNVLNVRKLQCVVSRKQSDYISMMIEELSEFQHPTNPDRKYVIGRMIHLDSNAQIGVNFHDAVLSHIDIAINLYIDNDADERMTQDLATGGKVQNATTRTHILRVEDIPFNSIFKFAWSFFRSKTLVAEWISTEFGPEYAQ